MHVLVANCLRVHFWAFYDAIELTAIILNSGFLPLQGFADEGLCGDDAAEEPLRRLLRPVGRRAATRGLHAATAGPQPRRIQVCLGPTTVHKRNTN